MSKPSICAPITITASNKWIDLFYAAAEHSVALTVGEYEDIYALAAEVQTQIRAIGAAQDATTVEVVTTTTPLGGIWILLETAASILWLTGTHNGSTCGTALGFIVTADDGSGTSHYSDYQAPNCWYAARSPVRYTREQPEFIGTELKTTLDQTDACVIDLGTVHVREAQFADVTAAKTWAVCATGSATNHDFETVWNALVGGSRGIYREDYAVPATHVHFWLEEPRNLLTGNVERPFNDLESYNFTLKMRVVE
jgi:hypothetical protein